ncbi:hypothetical protein J0A71_07g16390 [Encephalitozoon cuniculi]|nr:hypothetical protein J0A71_07g16390 [Encephalitozoon cuniculi]
MEIEDCMEDPDSNSLCEAADALGRVRSSIGAVHGNNGDCEAYSNSSIASKPSDIVRAYSYLLTCIDHVDGVPAVNFRDLFVVETFVLDRICEKKMLDFDRIFGEQRDPNAKRREMLKAMEGCLPNSPINIDCEQELDSLMYKVYKRRTDLNPKDIALGEIELLLVTLFRRSESSRFFKVFSRCKKSKGALRLGLLMGLKDGNDGLVDKLLRSYGEENLSTKSYFLDCKDDLIRRSIDPDWIMSVESNEEWLACRKEEMEWEECVHFWATNREGSSEAFNKSMMDLCIKHRKYEEGWIVYSKGCKKTPYVIHKACLLSLKALKETNDCKWISRLFEVIEASEPEEDDAKYLVANDVLENLSTLPENVRNLVLKGFITRIDLLDRNEEVVNLVIRGLLDLCRTCGHDKGHDLFGDYANLLYSKWKKHKLCGRYPPENQGKIESEIYSNMLSVFDALQDKEKVLSICRDMVNSNMKMTKELCSKIQTLHTVNLESFKSEPTSLEQYSVLERLVSLVLQKH